MQSKFKATLLGAAVGNAMGGPLSFMSDNQIQIKHGVVSEMIGGGWLNLRPGQYTGDIILLIATTETLIEKGRFDAEDALERYLLWNNTNPRDIGQTTRSVLATIVEEKAELGQAAAKVYRELTSKGEDNDFLPRCIPLALMHYNDHDQLIIETLKAAQMTHYNKKTTSGAVALNLLLARILNGEQHRPKIVSQVMTILDENDYGVYNVLPEIDLKKKEELQPTSRMQDTLEIALWCWRKTNSYREAIVTAINLGGNSDTIGAVIGAIAGAYYGEEQIPSQWLSRLEDKNIIASLARRLAKLVAPTVGNNIMNILDILVALSVFICAFAVTVPLVWLVRKYATQLGLVDAPGERKIHHQIIPSGGGIGIFCGVCLACFLGWYLTAHVDRRLLFAGQSGSVLNFGQEILLILGGGVVIFITGLVDDRCDLRPSIKLAVETAIALVLCWYDIRITVFVESALFSWVATVFWLLLITNAFNLLDNMDGLSSGVAFISGMIFLAVAVQTSQWRIAFILLALLGALLGFLCFNFPPASIFMGDSGSLFIGYMMGVLTIHATFYQAPFPLFPTFLPILVLAMPLFDTSTVLWIRWKIGHPFFKGDKRHFFPIVWLLWVCRRPRRC